MDQKQLFDLEKLGVLDFNQRITGLAAVTSYAQKIRTDPKWALFDRRLCWYVLKLSWQIEMPLTVKTARELAMDMKVSTKSEAKELGLILEWIEVKFHIKPELLLNEWCSCIQNRQHTAPYTQRLMRMLHSGHFENRLERKIWCLCECIHTLLIMQQHEHTFIALLYDPDYPKDTSYESVLLDLAYVAKMCYSERFSDYLTTHSTLGLYLTETAIKITENKPLWHAPLHRDWSHSLAHDIALYKQLLSELDRYHQRFLQTATILNPH